MLHCPKCGAEVSEDDSFCRRCGADLTQSAALQSTPEMAVKVAMLQRIDGIGRKNAEDILSLVDRERYTKFDDWPPFERQGKEALNTEAEAFKVLKEYRYETSDWRIDLLENVALASFMIQYQGTIRNRRFDMRSRVTAVFVKRDGEWKLLHEHWSSLPEGGWRRESKRRWLPI